MKDKTQKKHATEDGGKICILGGVRCHPVECSEQGCVFPSCAELVDRFDSLEQAKIVYPNIELV